MIREELCELSYMASSFRALLHCLLALSLLCSTAYGGQLTPTFYALSCPTLEPIVRTTMTKAIINERRMGASLLRLFFHDCFVLGCDGSILLDDTGSFVGEKTALPNASNRGYEVIDQIKANVEAVCPGVVSCADILAFAARDSVVLTGGLGYQVPSGRRDGRVSNATQATNNLPPPFFNATQLVDRFASKNLTLEDMVVLSGAHTLGVSHCSSFARPANLGDRLYNFSGSADGIDPALSKAYAFLLKSICPSNSSQFFPNTTTFMDIITPDKFDNKYYVGLTNNLGLFESDAALLTNATMKALVDSFVRNETTWKRKFAKSMVKMGKIEVLTGTQGEIRRNCRVINPASATDVLASQSGSSGFTGVAAS